MQPHRKTKSSMADQGKSGVASEALIANKFFQQQGRYFLVY